MMVGDIRHFLTQPLREKCLMLWLAKCRWYVTSWSKVKHEGLARFLPMNHGRYRWTMGGEVWWWGLRQMNWVRPSGNHGWSTLLTWRARVHKVKSMMKMVLEKSRRRTMVSWNLVVSHVSTMMMMMIVSLKSRRKESNLGGGWTLIDISESHLEGFVSLVLETRHRHPKRVFWFGPQN